MFSYARFSLLNNQVTRRKSTLVKQHFAVSFHKPHSAVQGSATHCTVAQCSATQGSTVQCRVAQCRVAHCRVTQCRVAQCRVVQRSTAQSSATHHPKTNQHMILNNRLSERNVQVSQHQLNTQTPVQNITGRHKTRSLVKNTELLLSGNVSLLQPLSLNRTITNNNDYNSLVITGPPKQSVCLVLFDRSTATISTYTSCSS